MNCPKCKGVSTVEYEADIAAPGFGQAWKCLSCETSFLKIRDILYDYADLDPEDLVMDPSDCI